MSNWVEPEPLDIPDDYINAIGGHPIVARTLYKRGMKDISSALAFMQPALYQPAHPNEMPGLLAAVDILEVAINNGSRIGVWGDFDVDGQTATALLVSTLRELNADVIYHIPDRVTESHGVNLPKLMDFIADGINLLLTCDTGISDHESIEVARKIGIKVIITDHHDLPAELPLAHAIVNPKLLKTTHPLRTLPGVGVAYKVVEELSQRYRQNKEIQPGIDLAALGIVADLALLVNDTRYLLQIGLKELQENPRTGLMALFEETGMDPKNITEEHISFILSPRLNALGRISDAKIGVELLLATDPLFAKECAEEIERLNEERRLITQQVFQAALAQIEADRSILSEPAIVVNHPEWPVGVIGIVANRLVEHYHRPAILISSPISELARGSARSVEGINISEAIAAQKDLLETFGGHPMAAGFSLRRELLPAFKKGLFKKLEEDYETTQENTRLQIDHFLRLSDLSIEFVSDLERLAPFGRGNPPIILSSRDLNLVNYSTVGRNDEHLIITIEDKFGTSKQAIWWQGSGWPLPDREFDLAYMVRSSNYRGKKDIQIEWLDYRYTAEKIISIQAETKSLTVVDYRTKKDPEQYLDELLQKGDIQVWGEGKLSEDIPGKNRFDLEKSERLAIWTIPPGRKELQEVLLKVEPSTIYLFAVDPGMDSADAFLIRLAGLLKYTVISKRGATSVFSLAAACAQRITTILEGLRWLQANNYFQIDLSDKENISIAESNNEVMLNEPDIEIRNRLKSLLMESAAYRRYFRRAEKNSLINVD